MSCRARDVLTPFGSQDIRVLREDWTEIDATSQREICAIRTSRENEAAQGLIGARGGGGLRANIARLLPGEREQGTPLHLLLDDFSGASLTANWAWSQWEGADWLRRLRENNALFAGRHGALEGVCSGFRPGSSALSANGGLNPSGQGTRVPPLTLDDDEPGWHRLPQQQGVGMRRARRIDVWLDEVVHVDAAFQDSANPRDGGDRVAVHEYAITARADPRTLQVTAIEVTPHVLPYAECLGAAKGAELLVDVNLDAFRAEVPVRLLGPIGCTHLNDMLRSMNDVPHLARRLMEERGERERMQSAE